MRTVAKFAFALATVTAVAACASKPPPAPPAPAPVAAAPPPARPAGPVPGSAEDFRVSVGDRVFFDYDQYTLRADARATLDRQAAWLKRYGAVRVLVDGNADERGTREYNLALGTRRANSVKEYLVSNGVAATRVDTVSYGKERPIATGSDEASWAQNRNGHTGIVSGAVS
ncbi:MAG TPA: peptidoglycan-associated lipoprotein Pal [Caulobacterales bacterium]|nr:peptidoglycan-associated lipoprotein Pal [Caulobacterales bacterium]